MSLDKRIARLERKVCGPSSGEHPFAAYLRAKAEAEMRLREGRPDTPTQEEVSARMTPILRSWGYELSDRWYQGGKSAKTDTGEHDEH